MAEPVVTRRLKEEEPSSLFVPQSDIPTSPISSASQAIRPARALQKCGILRRATAAPALCNAPLPVEMAMRGRHARERGRGGRVPSRWWAWAIAHTMPSVSKAISHALLTLESRAGAGGKVGAAS